MGTTEYMKSCRSCWYQEGGLCYCPKFPFNRDENGRSDKKAVEKCEHYWNKRAALTTVIPTELLVITSEETAKRED